MVALEELLRELSRADAWPAGRGEVETLHTHVSVLFFVGDRVYKVKKPVNLGFLDFTSLAARRHYCEEEVRLNQWLAPGVHLGVLPIVRLAGGRLRAGAAGEALEYAVAMKRLPAHQMLEAMLERGEIDNAALRRLAALLADFHAAAATGPEVDPHGDLPAVRRNVEENFQQLEPYAAARLLSPALLAAAARAARDFMAGRQELFARRVRQSRIREGHGDLHAGNVCFTGGAILIFDRIEFAARLRCGDVACDLAFLAMDLDRGGYRAFSTFLVKEYAARAGDGELEALIPFYKAYRALVRCKVAAMQICGAELPAEQRADAAIQAQRYLNLAASYDAPQALILTCGLPGSGKSWIAERLAAALGAIRLQSDAVRKRLAGKAPAESAKAPFGQGIYTSEFHDATYRALAEAAERHLAAGRTVIADASFAAAGQRRAFAEIASRRGVSALLIYLQVPEQLLRRRLELRAAERQQVSDADFAISQAVKQHFAEPAEWPADLLVRLGGSESAEAAVSLVVERLLGAAAPRAGA